MSLLTGLLDRVLLLLAVFCAGLLPSFVQQYRQRLGGRLDQVLSDIAPWQAIADRHHQGDLMALIRHHHASADPTFAAEAAAIESMLAQSRSLRNAMEAMQGDLLSQIWGWAQHATWNEVQATWALYQPNFPLDPEGLAFALILGAAIWLSAVSCGSCGAYLLRRRRAGNRHLQGSPKH